MFTPSFNLWATVQDFVKWKTLLRYIFMVIFIRMAYTCGCEVNKCQGFSFWNNIDQMAHFYLGPYSTKFCLILLKFWPEVASNKTNTVFGKSIKIFYFGLNGTKPNLLFCSILGPNLLPKNEKPKAKIT